MVQSGERKIQEKQVNDELISTEEMTDILRNTINHDLNRDVADAPEGTSFELTTPATGQRFRVTVMEVSPLVAVEDAIARILQVG
jgi:hypothetical protein